MLSHGLSSASNVAVFVAVAGSQSVATTARFSLFYTAWILLAAFCRMLLLEPLLRNAHLGDTWRRAVSLVAVTAGAASIVSIGGALVTGDAMWFIVAAGAPFLLAVDAVRYTAFAARMPAVAVRLDLIWFVVAFGLLLGRNSFTGAEPFFGIWVAGAGLAIAGSFKAIREVCHAAFDVEDGDAGSFRSLLGEGGTYLTGYVLSAGSTLVMLYVLAAFASEIEVATYRVALTVTGIVNVATAAIYAVAVPALSKLGSSNDDDSVSTVGYSALIAIGATIGLIAVPDSLGTMAFGASWSNMSTFRFMVALYFILKALEVPLVARFRGIGFPEVVMYGRVVYGVAVVSGMLLVAFGGLTAARAFSVATVALFFPLVYWRWALARDRYQVSQSPVEAVLL